MKGNADFNSLLVDSVDEEITQILGVKAASIVWRYWAISFGITRENMPNDLTRLFQSMQTIFGGETMGERVVKKLYMKANVPLEYSEGESQVEYAEKLQQILAKKPEQI